MAVGAIPQTPGITPRRHRERIINSSYDGIADDPYRYRRKLFSDKLAVEVNEPGPGAGVSRLKALQQSIMGTWKSATSRKAKAAHPTSQPGLSAPINFRVESRTFTTTHLSWENTHSSAATSISIERSPGLAGAWAVLKTETDLTVQVYEDSGLTCGAIYRYRIRIL